MKPYRNWDAEGDLFMDAMDILEEIHRETMEERAIQAAKKLREPTYSEAHKKTIAKRAIVPNGQKGEALRRNIKKIMEMRAKGITNRVIGDTFHCHESMVRWTLIKIRREAEVKA